MAGQNLLTPTSRGRSHPLGSSRPLCRQMVWCPQCLLAQCQCQCQCPPPALLTGILSSSFAVSHSRLCIGAHTFHPPSEDRRLPTPLPTLKTTHPAARRNKNSNSASRRRRTRAAGIQRRAARRTRDAALLHHKRGAAAGVAAAGIIKDSRKTSPSLPHGPPPLSLVPTPTLPARPTLRRHRHRRSVLRPAHFSLGSFSPFP